MNVINKKIDFTNNNNFQDFNLISNQNQNLNRMINPINIPNVFNNNLNNSRNKFMNEYFFLFLFKTEISFIL